MTRIVLIDNYDSFTWNLVHLIGALGVSVDVHRNDALSPAEIDAMAPDAVVLSPGPCTPNEAGVCLDVIRELGPTTPIFGVCLGLQSIGQAHGGDVVRAPLPMHGKVSTIRHRGETIFRGVNGPFNATRYHSLIVARDTCPADLAITAETDDGQIMALSHRSQPTHGVQFHPESILSEHGAMMIGNFLHIAAAWNAARPGRTAQDRSAAPEHRADARS